MDCSPPGSSVHEILQTRITRVCCHALLQGIFPTQGLNPYLCMSPALQAGSLPLVPPGKPRSFFTFWPKLPFVKCCLLTLSGFYNTIRKNGSVETELGEALGTKNLTKHH